MDPPYSPHGHHNGREPVGAVEPRPPWSLRRARAWCRPSRSDTWDQQWWSKSSWLDQLARFITSESNFHQLVMIWIDHFTNVIYLVIYHKLVYWKTSWWSITTSCEDRWWYELLVMIANQFMTKWFSTQIGNELINSWSLLPVNGYTPEHGSHASGISSNLTRIS